jgi:peptide-methionine (S)-S-oxide reductase
MKLNNLFNLAIAIIFLFSQSSCAQTSSNKSIPKMQNQIQDNSATDSLETAILGGGCFWCVEAQYLMLDGVIKVESGYSGGNTENPTYKEVCTGTTNHAEVIKVTYNKNKLSFDDILYAFWQSHDPTTLNRQGADEGTQYRSVIFYTTPEQKEKAEQYIKKLNDEKAFADPIVTEVSELKKFYIAEDYHQNYYNQNKNQGYCMFVIGPKIEKFKKVFQNQLKK